MAEVACSGRWEVARFCTSADCLVASGRSRASIDTSGGIRGSAQAYRVDCCRRPCAAGCRHAVGVPRDVQALVLLELPRHPAVRRLVEDVVARRRRRHLRQLPLRARRRRLHQGQDLLDHRRLTQFAAGQTEKKPEAAKLVHPARPACSATSTSATRTTRATRRTSWSQGITFPHDFHLNTANLSCADCHSGVVHGSQLSWAPRSRRPRPTRRSATAATRAISPRSSSLPIEPVGPRAPGSAQDRRQRVAQHPLASGAKGARPSTGWPTTRSSPRPATRATRIRRGPRRARGATSPACPLSRPLRRPSGRVSCPALIFYLPRRSWWS